MASVPYKTTQNSFRCSAKVWTYILYVLLSGNKILQSVVARRVRPVFVGRKVFLCAMKERNGADECCWLIRASHGIAFYSLSLSILLAISFMKSDFSDSDRNDSVTSFLNIPSSEIIL